MSTWNRCCSSVNQLTVCKQWQGRSKLLCQLALCSKTGNPWRNYCTHYRKTIPTDRDLELTVEVSSNLHCSQLAWKDMTRHQRRKVVTTLAWVLLAVLKISECMYPQQWLQGNYSTLPEMYQMVWINIELNNWPIFGHIRKIEKSDYQICHIRPSSICMEQFSSH